MQMMKTIAGLATVVMFLTLGNTAQADDWVGGGADNEFSTALNWDTGNVPGVIPGSDPPVLSTNRIDGAFTVERSVDSVSARTFVQGGAVLNVTGGFHDDTQPGANRWNFVGQQNGSGTVNQSGGTYRIGHGLRVGHSNGGNPGAEGTYNLTGGLLEVYRGSNSSIDGTNPGGRPSLEVGSETPGAAALFGISGGALGTRAGVHIGSTGTFSVVGSAATSISIGSIATVDGAWVQTAGSTLKATIDAGGVTPIFIDDVANFDTILAEFRSGSRLELGFNGITPTDGTWTILEAENTPITDLGLGLSSATASGWSFDVDNTGTNGLLTATFTAVPEPSSLVLIGLGGTLLIGRRRLM